MSLNLSGRDLLGITRHTPRQPTINLDLYLIIKFDSTSDGLSEGEAGGLGLDVAQLLPLLGGQVLGN